MKRSLQNTKMSRLIKILIWVLFLSPDDAIGLRNRLNGRHLVTSTVIFPPFMLGKRTSNGTDLYGPLVEHVDWLSRRLNFSYSLNTSPGDVIGVEENGTWNGLIGQLIRNEVDIGVFCFRIALQRFRLFQLSGFFTGDSIGLLVQYPSSQVSWSAPVQPYNYQVWTGWILSLIVVAATCYVLVHLRAKFEPIDGYRRFRTVDEMFIYIFGVITAQGGFYRFGNKHLGILAASWCLASCVFVYVYNCTLVSYLATSYKEPAINSLQQLADSHYHVVTIKGTMAESGILSATTGASKVLGDRLRRCPGCRMTSNEDFARQVKQGRSVGTVAYTACNDLVRADYAATRKCHLTLAYEKTNWNPLTMGVPKSSPYVEEINRESLWAHAFGLPFKWKSYQPDFGPCKLNYNRNGVEVKSQNRRLQVRQFYLAFLLLAAGFLLSAIAFLYERIRWHLIYAPRSSIQILM